MKRREMTYEMKWIEIECNEHKIKGLQRKKKWTEMECNGMDE